MLGGGVRCWNKKCHQTDGRLRWSHRLGPSPAIHHPCGLGNLGTFLPLPVQWDKDLKVAE